MRPPKPLISKDEVSRIALDILESEGAGALTIRRIAAKIGVNGASLYHHFHNKHEILESAAQLALTDARVPQYEGEFWKYWCLRNALGLYHTLLRYPDIIPVLLRRKEHQLGFKDLDFYFAEFERQGVPSSLQWTLLELLQAFAIGTVQQECAGLDNPVLVSDEYPAVKRATERRRIAREETFVLGCRALIDAVGVESVRQAQVQVQAQDEADALARSAVVQH